LTVAAFIFLKKKGYKILIFRRKKLVKITSEILQKLLIAVNECIEWGQVFILDCLANYVPDSEQEADS
jgi:AP-2 complex subunit beta-1